MFVRALVIHTDITQSYPKNEHAVIIYSYSRLSKPNMNFWVNCPFYLSSKSNQEKFI